MMIIVRNIISSVCSNYSSKAKGIAFTVAVEIKCVQCPELQIR